MSLVWPEPQTVQPPDFMRTKTKSIMTVCLAAALIFAAVMGTIAYMTATDSKTNTFTVGSFSKPATGPTGEAVSLDGYIYEPQWDSADSHQLVPGKSVVKDPYVGIGAGSEEAYVYVYIDNKVLNTSDKKYVTFTPNSGWEPVTGQVIEGDDAGTYVSGMFRYSTKLAPGADTDAWTSAVFEEVNISEKAQISNFSDEPTMTVYAYIHQAKDDNGDIDAATVDNAAKAWKATCKK